MKWITKNHNTLRPAIIDYYETHKTDPLNDIWNALAQIIKDDRIINRKYHYNRKKGEFEQIDKTLEKIRYSQYNIRKNCILLELSINDYFGLDYNNFFKRVRVEYVERYGNLHVKQPLWGKIDKTDALFRVLKDMIYECQWDNDSGFSCLAYATNLLDLSL
ncbi:MAG: hypothetical protein IJ104_00895 [Methanobrevibacter sp.]|nr:hypothetical protein [Methanobrevibacter sp.]MBQ9024927.1 hypothetical protein [Methanobrevibacter sp.]